MCEEFARRLTAIRKDKKISQKQAAEDLGVSQALLSHYEKGVRECGLSFVIKAAEYYGVSADYLLNLSPVMSGGVIEDLEDPSEDTRPRGSISSSLAKRMVYNGIDMIYAQADAMSDKSVGQALNNYFFLSVYKAFRIFYDSNPENEDSFFMVDKADAPYLTDAALSKTCADIQRGCLNKKNVGEKLGQSIIEQKYPDRAAGLLNLIRNAESKIEK